MNRFWHSLHLRLGLILGLMLIVLWLSLWLGSNRIADETATDDIDTRLRTTAISLASVMAGQSFERRSADDRDMNAGGADASRLYFEIRDRGSKVLIRSRDYPSALSATALGFISRETGGQQWRVYTWIDGATRLTVRVATRADAAAAQRSAELRHQFSLPLLWLLPILVAMTAFTLWQGLAPLRRIERALARQHLDDLTPLRLDSRRVPRELQRLIATLDSLLLRVSDLLARQRLFSAGAAHELRTPLAACRSQAEIAERSRDPEQIRHAAVRVQQSIDRMSTLISQLLLLARADNRNSVAQGVPVALDKLVAGASERALSAARHADVQIEFACGAGPFMVTGDAQLLDCLVDNLIANAVNFAPAGTAVNLDLDRDPEGIALTVRDRGPGIDADDSERLFDPFYRGGNNGQTQPGSGLGLSIVKTIVDSHHGTIELGSAAAGTGTVACVRLQPAGQARVAISARP